MKTVTINTVTTTGLDPDFDDVRYFEIDDKPFAEGGFGRIYHCRSINGKPFKNPQVIKIFKDNRGSAAHSYKTIRGLQDGLIRKKAELEDVGVDFLYYYPAFFGAPQFVFEGELDGDTVQGYSANNLKAFGYSCFSEVIEKEDIAEQYDDVSLENRYAKAYHLARAFTLLNEIRYIHADFKADNFFVSIDNDGRCALIDFDSGAIINELEDETFTVGTPSQDMLAPEIRKQLNETGRASVNLLTDTWSVAVACHYLMFLMHPFDILTEVSDNAIDEYSSQFTWPEVDDDFEYFDPDEARETADWLRDVCNTMPQGIIDCFRHTFTKGYFNPHYRTSYAQWCLKLKSYLPEGEERRELSKIRRDLDKSKLLEEERRRKEEEERKHLASMIVTPSDFPHYISSLVMELIKKNTFFNLHQEELEKVGKQLGIADLEKKVLSYVTAYYDIWSGGIVTATQRKKLQFLGKSLKMPEQTTEYLLNNKL